MLILDRKAGEAIVIEIGGQTVTIRVTEVGSVRIRVGITAPYEMPVYRQEIQRRIEQQKRKSA